MSFEKPSMEKPGQLNKEEAHAEANKLRASMRMNPETGKLIRTYNEIKKSVPEQSHNVGLELPPYLLKLAEERKVTRKDYDAAIKELDKLEMEAEKDPGVLLKLSQYAQTPILGAEALAFVIVGGVINSLGLNPVGPKENSKEHLEQALYDLKQEKNNIFSDARSKLERLEAEGEKFGQAQSKAGKNEMETE